MTLIRCLSAPAASCRRQNLKRWSKLEILKASLVHNSISPCRPLQVVLQKTWEPSKPPSQQADARGRAEAVHKAALLRQRVTQDPVLASSSCSA